MSVGKYVPPQCFLCDKPPRVMLLDTAAFSRWENGALIQDAFPDMPADEREELKTGTHAECWARMFGDDDAS